MADQNVINYHVQYMAITSQHWHPESERFAGMDHLLTALDNGWEIDNRVEMHRSWYTGLRYGKLYHFTLTRGDEKMVMPVLFNPYLNRFIEQSGFDVVDMDEERSA